MKKCKQVKWWIFLLLLSVLPSQALAGSVEVYGGMSDVGIGGGLDYNFYEGEKFNFFVGLDYSTNKPDYITITIPQYSNSIIQGKFEMDREATATMLTLGTQYVFNKDGKIRPFISLAIGYLSMSVEISGPGQVSDVNYSDTVLTAETDNTGGVGGIATFGVEWVLSESFGVGLTGRYRRLVEEDWEVTVNSNTAGVTETYTVDYIDGADILSGDISLRYYF
ncbi:MAG: porin family protein [Proteobacteria bacterium]|nr:porin family protein [Pseudomonadota bacterium]MBU1714876.1 porin family protein [Pseudomonadota bacterium]